MNNKKRADRVVTAYHSMDDGSGLSLSGIIQRALNEAEARGRKAGLEEAAKVAHDYGYTFDCGEHQPWAREANMALRSQNLEIEKRIRALASTANSEETS